VSARRGHLGDPRRGGLVTRAQVSVATNNKTNNRGKGIIRKGLIASGAVLAMLASTVAAQPAQASYGQQVRNMHPNAGAVTAFDMAQTIMGGATTVSNAVFNGDQLAGGIVTGFDGIGLPTAAVLSTGIVSQAPDYCNRNCVTPQGSAVIGPNWSETTSSMFRSTNGDTDLDQLYTEAAWNSQTGMYARSSTVASLQFDFVAKSGTVQIPFIFGSDGYAANWKALGYVYPDLRQSYFSSIVGIFVNNVNCALVGPRNEIVGVASVNHLRNTDYYRANPAVEKFTGESRYPTGFNGITTVLTCNAAVKSGQMNHVKIAIGNQYVNWYDSAVFVGAGSFVPDNPDPNKSTLTVDKNSTPVNTNITATATVKDSADNPLPGITVSFTKGSADVSLQAPTCTTGATGTCQITATSAKPVTDQLWATVMSGGTVIQLNGSPQAMAWTALGPDKDKSHLDLDKPSTPINTNIRATTTVADSDGKPLQGVTVTYSKTSAAVNLSAPTCQTEANGTCYVDVTSAVKGSYPNEVHAKIMVGGALVDVKNSPASVEFTVGGPDKDKSTLELDKASTAVGTDITATTTVRDAGGNPLQGVTVSYSNVSPEVHIQKPSCDTDATGKCSITVTSTVAKSYPDELHAKIPVGGVLVDVTGSPASMTFTSGGPDKDKSTLELDKPSTPVGTNITATTTVRDANNNPLSGITVFYAKKSGAVSLDQPSCQTGTDGKCSVKVTSGTAGVYPGEVSASVTIGGQPVQVTGSPASVEFTSAGPNTSSFDVNPKPDPFDRGTWMVANGTDAYTGVLTLKDDAGNPVKNANVTDIVVDKMNPNLQITVAVNNGDGTYTVKITSNTMILDGWVRLKYKGTVIGTSYNCLFSA